MPATSFLRYRLSTPACLLLLLMGGALCTAQFASRYAYSRGRTDVHAFGWPLPFDCSHFMHLSRWGLHPQWYWSSSRLSIDLSMSVMLLAGTVCAAEIHLRQWPRVQFGLRQLLTWTAIAGLLISLGASERQWVEWAMVQLGEPPRNAPSIGWVRLQWHIHLPVMFSIGCSLDTLGHGLLRVGAGSNFSKWLGQSDGGLHIDQCRGAAEAFSQHSHNR